MIVGTCVIREPLIEANCEPMRDGGWRVTSARGVTEHSKTGDPYLAVSRHVEATTRQITSQEEQL